MALSIPEDEMDLCLQLMRPAYAVMTLTNDFFSWEKERDELERGDRPNITNAIDLIMRERSMTEDEAKDVCREVIQKYVADSIRTNEETQRNLEISSDLRTFMEAMQYSVSGNIVWSNYCPRYHPEVFFNDVQLSLFETSCEIEYRA